MLDFETSKIYSNFKSLKATEQGSMKLGYLKDHLRSKTEPTISRWVSHEKKKTV